jgi:NADPH-dependent 2,4-dienoyl-CoA reductase/sulfur reductase-like enzyme
MQSIFRYGRLECLVNPSLGREQEMQITPTEKRKKVMVIGGGPGGLNAAWVAAKRGHDVHLYEKQPVLGGQLVPGSRTAYKREMQSLINFQKKQVELNGVACHLGQTATAETVLKAHPDVVILATGSKPILPPVNGIDSDSVITFDVVLNEKNQKNQETVVIGGGATGCEVAYHLSESGSPVTIVEVTPKIGGDLEAITKKILIRRLKENNVNILTEHRLLRVEKDGAVVAGVDEIEMKIEADRVVVAIGIHPDDTIHQKIRDLGYETHVIGDCFKPRSAKSAIYEGAKLGQTI